MSIPLFCIHIGLPKTATTTMQKQLFPHHDQIEYLGKYIKAGMDRKQKYLNVHVGTLVESSFTHLLDSHQIESFTRILHETILPRLASHKLIVLSLEGISSGALPNRELRAVNLKKILGMAKIMIVLRHPVELIESLYFQKLKEANILKMNFWAMGPRYFTIDQWLKRNWKRSPIGPLWNIDYYRTIEVFSRIFGKGNVGIFIYEQLKENPQDFINRLCGFMGIDPEETLRLLSGRKMNVRYNDDVLSRLEDIRNSFFRSLLFHLSSREQRKKKLGLIQSSNETGMKRAAADMPEVWKTKIEAYTRPGNRELVDKWGLPLGRYKYPL